MQDFIIKGPELEFEVDSYSIKKLCIPYGPDYPLFLMGVFMAPFIQACLYKTQERGYTKTLNMQ